MNRPMDMRTMRDMMRGRGRRSMMSGRSDMAMDGRNRYGSAGGYVSSRRPRRDRAMESDMARGGRGSSRGSNDYGTYDPEYDSRYDNDYATGEYNTRDSVYGRELYGYYGDTPFEIRRSYPMRDYNMDYARGGRRDYGYDYNYGMDYGMDYGEDYGEKLNEEELEHWCKKMVSKLDEREKQIFSKESILQKAKNMGIQFDGFSEMEFYVNVIKNYTDHKKSIGENPDMAIKLSRDDFNDEDGEYKGSEWLAIYFDTFVKQ